MRDIRKPEDADPKQTEPKKPLNRKRSWSPLSDPSSATNSDRTGTEKTEADGRPFKKKSKGAWEIFEDRDPNSPLSGSDNHSSSTTNSDRTAGTEKSTATDSHPAEQRPPLGDRTSQSLNSNQVVADFEALIKKQVEEMRKRDCKTLDELNASTGGDLIDTENSMENKISAEEKRIRQKATKLYDQIPEALRNAEKVEVRPIYQPLDDDLEQRASEWARHRKIPTVIAREQFLHQQQQRDLARDNMHQRQQDDQVHYQGYSTFPLQETPYGYPGQQIQPAEASSGPSQSAYDTQLYYRGSLGEPSSSVYPAMVSSEVPHSDHSQTFDRKETMQQIEDINNNMGRSVSKWAEHRQKLQSAINELLNNDEFLYRDSASTIYNAVYTGIYPTTKKLEESINVVKIVTASIKDFENLITTYREGQDQQSQRYAELENLWKIMPDHGRDERTLMRKISDNQKLVDYNDERFESILTQANNNVVERDIQLYARQLGWLIQDSDIEKAENLLAQNAHLENVQGSRDNYTIGQHNIYGRGLDVNNARLEEIQEHEGVYSRDNLTIYDDEFHTQNARLEEIQEHEGVYSRDNLTIYDDEFHQ